MGTQTAVHTPAFRNCVFQNLTFLNHLKKNITITGTSFCNLKVSKSATKNRKKKEENLSTYEKTMPQIYFTFSHGHSEILKNIVSGGWCMERKDTIQPAASLARKPMGDSSV